MFIKNPKKTQKYVFPFNCTKKIAEELSFFSGQKLKFSVSYSKLPTVRFFVSKRLNTENVAVVVVVVGGRIKSRFKNRFSEIVYTYVHTRIPPNWRRIYAVYAMLQNYEFLHLFSARFRMLCLLSTICERAKKSFFHAIYFTQTTSIYIHSAHFIFFEEGRNPL